MIVFIQKIEEGIVWSSWQLQQVFGGRDSDQKKKNKKKLCYTSICAAKLFYLALQSLFHRLYQAGVNTLVNSLNN